MGQRIWGTLFPFLEGGAVLGRKVGNKTFVEALFRADPYDEYHFFMPDKDDCARLDTWTAEYFPALVGKVRGKLLHTLPKEMAKTAYHCMHIFSPEETMHRLAQIRNAFSPTLFPVTGVTHSLSYREFTQEFATHIWKGTSERDAVIVTSECARAIMAQSYASIQEDYELDKQLFCVPSLEKIPLAVDLNTLPTPEERWDSKKAMGQAAKNLRQEMGIGKNQTVFLSFSRLSPYSKMDLMPLFAAFRRAGQLGLTAEKYVVILAGWAQEGDLLPERLQAYAASMGIHVILALRPDDGRRRLLYALADVFISPSDNIQETFGITIIEAMASSLPVLASDFDGYRDTVAPECGILVPTLGFPCSAEADMQALVWSADHYHLKFAQQSVVDVPALAAAIARLGEDRSLRKNMGAQARKRAESLYSWDIVIKKYVEVWDKLAAIPLTSEREQALREAKHPLTMRYAELFRKHYTQVLTPEALEAMTLKKTPAGEALYRGILPPIMYPGMETFIDNDAVRVLLMTVRKTVPAMVAMERLQRFLEEKDSPAYAKERAATTILWALKHDYLEMESTLQI